METELPKGVLEERLRQENGAGSDIDSTESDDEILNEFRRLESMWIEKQAIERQALAEARDGFSGQDRPVTVSEEALQGCKLRFSNLNSFFRKDKVPEFQPLNVPGAENILWFFLRLDMEPDGCLGQCAAFADVEAHDVYSSEPGDDDSACVIEFSSQSVAALFYEHLDGKSVRGIKF